MGIAGAGGAITSAATAATNRHACRPVSIRVATTRHKSTRSVLVRGGARVADSAVSEGGQGRASEFEFAPDFSALPVLARASNASWRKDHPLAIQQFARHLSGIVRQRTQLRTNYMRHASESVRYSAHGNNVNFRRLVHRQPNARGSRRRCASCADGSQPCVEWVEADGRCRRPLGWGAALSRLVHVLC
jgi:hypothetical protein